MTTLLAAIQFDPNIRGLLVVMVGVVVLIGSVYLLLATNTGVRLGFLIAMAGLAGWMFTMGLIWWMYGIGLKGRDPSWIEQEINFSRSDSVITEQVAKLPPTEELPDPAEFLDQFVAENPEVGEQILATEGESFSPSTLTETVTVAPELKAELNDQLNGWRILPESDSRRGDAVAAADASLAANQAFGQNTSTTQYTVKDVFLYGGKTNAEPESVEGEYNFLEQAWRRVSTIFQPKNPPLYAAVTVQKNEAQVVAPGEAPPPPQVDENADTVTVVLLRNLGTKRLIPFLFTLFSGIAFAVLAWMLHTRDKRAMEVRAEWDPSKAAIPAKVG
jgi:hypothetical protein